MSFISFLNDLGIVPNKGTNMEGNPGLSQGSSFMDFNRMYHRNTEPKVKALQTSGIEGIETVTEAMQADDNITRKSTDVASNSVSSIEIEFNKTLVDYNTTYRSFAEEIIKKAKADKDLKQYYGQAITAGDGNYMYVNDYGYTQKYSTDAWSANAESCPSDPVTLSDKQVSMFNVGAPIGEGQSCGVAGRNIKNKDSSEYAWVDIKGYKHVYSDDTWAAKSEMCNVPVTELESDDYEAIPSGSAMTSASNCERLDVDPAVWNKLVTLNRKLVSLAQKMTEQLTGVVAKDVRLQQSLEDEKIKLAAYVAELDNQQKQMSSSATRYVTVAGEYEDAQLNANSDWLHLLAYFILMILIIVMTFRIYFSPTNKFINIIAIIIGVLGVYVIIRSLIK